MKILVQQDKDRSHDQPVATTPKAIELNSDIAIASHIRGMAHYREGNHTRSIADLTPAIELNPHAVWPM